MNLKELAAKIDAHLKRFEADPKINARHDGKSILPFWRAGAHQGGSRVMITYVSFQGSTGLSKSEAIAYLAWLDAGNVGQHWRATT